MAEERGREAQWRREGGKKRMEDGLAMRSLRGSKDEFTGEFSADGR